MATLLTEYNPQPVTESSRTLASARRKIAIIGSGVSGLVTAHLLAPAHDITVFEADDRIGGHVNTVTLALEGRDYEVDVGFVVFNRRTYPHFSALLDRLGVVSTPTRMSFSVRSEADNVEYNGESLKGLFAQPRNALRPAFLRMLLEILRFNRAARYVEATCTEPLGAFLCAGGYSKALREWYVLPLVGCIWSVPRGCVEDFPVGPLMIFLRHHGLLDVFDRPTWRIIQGGARRYVEALVQPFRDRIRLRHAVDSVSRTERAVWVRSAGGAMEAFDEVVVAVHGDQVLGLLANPSHEERVAFRGIHYEENAVLVHTDDSLLPRRANARACWNAFLPASPDAKACVTYDMNLLQGLQASRPICVSLNATDEISSAAILRRLHYRHPVLSADAINAQGLLESLNGRDRVYYCGAYFGYGFHEDGVTSAMAVARRVHAR